MPRPRALLVALALWPAPAPAQDRLYLPTVAPASSEPERALKAIRRPDDIAVSLFAAEPRVANPVAFAFDPKGRLFVVETFRLHAGVTDNRSHMDWLDDDLAARTVADREAMMRKWLGTGAETFAVEHDRIRLIEDRDGDGKADHDTVFADGFHGLASGIGAGILPMRDGVYFACIPDLWLLKETKGGGKADRREVLSTGYGVHVAFLGHDLHGLILGPDGRLYFTIGDRGLNVTTREGKALANLDSGSVLRCEPDGSNLEIFATGLRNPQELAFDNSGNLFTVDNNSDAGDRARVVHLVEGGDSGWRVGYQYLEKPVSRGPWEAEKLWHPAPANTAAYLLPPLMNLSDGPSGLTFDPGVTLLPIRFKGHFFLADFRGGAGQSGVRSFAVEPHGASFKVVDTGQPIWSVLATDVDFGPDGALYVSDWVEGWNKTGKGRVWRFADKAREKDAAVAEVKSLLAGGIEDKTVDELGDLLGHADRRVRQAAQFALVRIWMRKPLDLAIGQVVFRGPDPRAAAKLRAVAEHGPSLTARLHALWGLGQLVRAQSRTAYDVIAGLRNDPDPEVRAQVAKLLGDLTPRVPRARGEGMAFVGKLLDDPSPRVRFYAAQTIGKMADPDAIGPLFKLLEDNNDRDPYLRHAAVLGLAGIGDVAALTEASAHPSPAVRLGALLAIRRAAPDALGAFLDDKDPRIVLEAARAIYDDHPKNGVTMEALAALAGRPGLDEPTLRRVLNANARLGGSERAEALANVALRGDAPTPARVEAIELLGDWAKPSGRDRISGLWRPYPGRHREQAVAALKSRLDALLKADTKSVRRAAVVAAGALEMAEAVPALVALAGDPKASALTRVESLKALESIGDPKLGDAAASAAEATDSRVRTEAQRLLAKVRPERAVPLLAKVLDSGSNRERQGALTVLAGLARPDADALIAGHLKANDLPPEVELELTDAAARRRSDPAIRSALGARDGSKPKDDPLGEYRPILVGGDSARGRSLFQNNAAVYCVRCHKLNGRGGEVGPDLTGIGRKQTREYLATSIVHPNAAIAQGFETVVVSLADGRIVSGVLRSEDDRTIRLVSPEGQAIDVPKSEVEDRRRGPSAMPDDVARKLSKAELRDLVEFLATRR